MKTKLFLVLLLAVGLSGCDLFKKKEDLNLPTTPATQSAENDLVTFTRTALEAVKKGAVFLVHVQIVAKTDLDLLAVSEVVPPDFVVVSGETTAFLANVGNGDTLEMTYSLQASAPKGTFKLSGFSRAKPAGDDSLQLELVSPLQVK